MNGSSGTPTSRSLERIGILYESYQRDGADYRSHGAKLDEKWKSISGLPHPEGGAITRRSIQDAWRRADSTESARNALFETLIWGYGKDHRGPTNFGRIRDNLELNPSSYNELLVIREVAQRQSVEAFGNLLHLEITGLGFVYATKVIYAMGGNAPILDQRIETWLSHFGENLSPISSANTRSHLRQIEIYKEYLTWFHSMSVAHLNDEMGSVGDIALVEYMMFWDVKSENASTRKEQPNWIKGVPRWSDS